MNMDALVERAATLQREADEARRAMRDLVVNLDVLAGGLAGLAREMQAMRGTPAPDRQYTPHGSHGPND